MSTSIGAGGGAGNDSDGPKVSRVHVESHPVAKPEPTVTWPVKDGDILLGTVRLSKGVHECVLPDGSVVETFKTLKFALEFLHERGRPIPPEEQATRLKADVDALSQQSPTGQMFWLPDYAKRYGIEESKLQQMIAAEVEAAEKKKRVDAAEQRRREDREEKQRTLEKREREHEAEKKQRLERQERKEADQKAEKKERERQKALAGIAKLPRAEHEAKLQQLARRLDEDVDALREELELLLVDAETAKVREAAEPWFESVDANELLHATEAQLRAYLVIHDPAAAAIYTLAVPIAWVHEESATFSPIVGVQGADSEAGKSLLCDVHSLLTPRAHVIVKPTGASLYRLVDYHRPTLYVDNADRLLAGDRDLADIVNSSWTRGHLIPRTVKGIVYEFNPFCFKFINGIDLLPHLEPATRTRCITTEMLKKLPGEKVTHFKYAASDERFSILRRKWLRFSIDNAALIKSADPVMPEGFSNRLAENYVLFFAAADVAGGAWPQRMRKAAVKLTREYNKPSLGLRCLAQFYEFLETHGIRGRAGTLLITSEQLEKLFEATQEDDWCNYLGSGHPINHWQISELLRPFYRGPNPRPLIHPPGTTARGFDAAWFETGFKHFLGKPLPQPRKGKKK